MSRPRTRVTQGDVVGYPNRYELHCVRVLPVGLCWYCKEQVTGEFMTLTPKAVLRLQQEYWSGSTL